MIDIDIPKLREHADYRHHGKHNNDKDSQDYPEHSVAEFLIGYERDCQFF